MSALNGGDWSAPRPDRFTTGERSHNTHWMGGWVGLRVGMDAVVKGTITLHYPYQE